MIARLVALALIAAVLVVAGLACYAAVIVDAGSHPTLTACAIVVNGYFFVRFAFAGFLVFNGRPMESGTIAWYSARDAHLQGMLALAGAVALLFASRRTGAAFVASTMLAHAAIALMARVRVLACTQGWADCPSVGARHSAAPRRRHRWIRAAPQERPLVKPPLPPAPDATELVRRAFDRHALGGPARLDPERAARALLALEAVTHRDPHRLAFNRNDRRPQLPLRASPDGRRVDQAARLMP